MTSLRTAREARLLPNLQARARIIGCPSTLALRALLRVLVACSPVLSWRSAALGNADLITCYQEI